MDHKFKQHKGLPNLISERGDYYLSYNRAPGGGFRIFEGDSGADETAIVVKRKPPTEEDVVMGLDRDFFILNGDHREAYEKCKTLQECMDYFHAHEELKSSWSN